MAERDGRHVMAGAQLGEARGLAQGTAVIVAERWGAERWAAGRPTTDVMVMRAAADAVRGPVMAWPEVAGMDIMAEAACEAMPVVVLAAHEGTAITAAAECRSADAVVEAADLAAMAITVAAARMRDKVTGAGMGGIEVQRADMVPAVTRNVDLVVGGIEVGGRADPTAGSANGVPADRAAAAALAAGALRARAAQVSAGSVVGGR